MNMAELPGLQDVLFDTPAMLDSEVRLVEEENREYLSTHAESVRIVDHITEQLGEFTSEDMTTFAKTLLRDHEITSGGMHQSRQDYAHRTILLRIYTLYLHLFHIQALEETNNTNLLEHIERILTLIRRHNAALDELYANAQYRLHTNT